MSGTLTSNKFTLDAIFPTNLEKSWKSFKIVLNYLLAIFISVLMNFRIKMQNDFQNSKYSSISTWLIYASNCANWDEEQNSKKVQKNQIHKNRRIKARTVIDRQLE